jgi:hypothetical protein
VNVSTGIAGKMEPESGENRLKLQIRALHSGNRSAILSTLREIRYTGSVAILPELFELLLDQEDPQIIAEITNLLNDLKEQEAAGILAEAIENAEYAQISAVLVAACWQNGLSYDRYTDTFVRAAIRGDYATAIEAFTVIEEEAGNLDKEQRQRLAGMITRGIEEEVDEQKKILLKELVKVVNLY